MTTKKCLEVLDRYEKTLNGEYHRDRRDSVSHLMTMLPKMRAMLLDHCDHLDTRPREKFMRWLGFMQGVFWVWGWYELDELKEHNRGT